MNMKTKTLAQVCKLLENYKLYDFSTPLQVHYREPEPDCQNGYFGSCVVGKEDGIYKELFIDDKERGLYHDGDYYGLDVDEIFMWEFEKERGVHEPMLTVYVIAEWSDK